MSAVADIFSLGGDWTKCHLSRLMGERKLKIADVARVPGVHRNTLTLLEDETAVRADLEAIEKLCALFDVSVPSSIAARSSTSRMSEATR